MSRALASCWQPPFPFMRTTFRFKEISISRWFPPNDPIAAAVARLCILREDFYLEGIGFGSDDLSALDGNGQAWRSLYFLRQAVRTLQEARGAIMTLNQDRDFQNALRDAGEDFQSAVRNFQNLVEAADLREVRNALGGHVQHSAVEKFLNGLNQDIKGLAVFAPTHKDTHYKFTAEIVLGMLTQGVPDDLERDRLRRIAEGQLSGLMSAVDGILTVYASARHLI